MFNLATTVFFSSFVRGLWRSVSRRFDNRHWLVPPTRRPRAIRDNYQLARPIVSSRSDRSISLDYDDSVESIATQSTSRRRAEWNKALRVLFTFLSRGEPRARVEPWSTQRFIFLFFSICGERNLVWQVHWGIVSSLLRQLTHFL